MPEQRIKGQETSLVFILNGLMQEGLVDIQNHEAGFQFDILQEGYLGETTDRYDEVFRGIRGRADLHIETGDVFDFVFAVLNRARRREPGTKINIKDTFTFPNGEVKRLVIPNVFFGPIPIATPSRADYVKVSLEYAASIARVIS